MIVRSLHVCLKQLPITELPPAEHEVSKATGDSSGEESEEGAAAPAASKKPKGARSGGKGSKQKAIAATVKALGQQAKQQVGCTAL